MVQLKKKGFRIRVKTVTKDSKGDDLGEVNYYSKVDRIESIVGSSVLVNQ